MATSIPKFLAFNVVFKKLQFNKKLNDNALEQIFMLHLWGASIGVSREHRCLTNIVQAKIQEHHSLQADSCSQK